MADDSGGSILTATCFQIGMLGTKITQAFSDRIEHVGITHKQVSLLAVVDAGLAQSQREIADHLQVAPSLIVSLADQLVALGAIARSRSTSDRRVQIIELTDHGRELLAAAANAATEVDAAFRASLSAPGRAALDTLLRELNAQYPPGAPAS